MATFLATSTIVTNILLQASTTSMPPVDTRFEPSPAHPFGRPNPEAPAELSDFAFFVGAFDCQDSRRTADGSFIHFPAVWNGKYFMNGHGIQDQYWAPGFYTSNIRLFDERDGKWKVTFFAEPGYSTGTWIGGKEGENIVLTRTVNRPDGTESLSRLTFYEITQNGFRWRGESVAANTVTTNWTSDCVRR